MTAPRLAAIDVGTNTIRLLVAEVEPDGTYRVLDEEREAVRLGQGVGRTGRLSADAIERGLAAIGKMKAIADGFEVDELRAVATSAVREASNGRMFCREVLRRHKVRLEVISGEDEARLVFRSVARHFDLEGRSSALVDIGGGSLEVVLAAGLVVDQVHSLPLGAVRVTEEFVRSDPLKRRHWRRLKKAVDREIRDALGNRPPFVPEVIIGSGGTFTALAHLARWQREGRDGSVHGMMLARADVTHLLHQLRESPLEARRELPGIPPDRADIIVGGAAVVSRLARWLGTRQILVNERGVRDGLILQMIADLHGRTGGVEPVDRMEGVRVLARKCRSNERHCEHVARLAGQVFDGLAGHYELPAGSRDLLVAAALLHDVGYIISHSKHHKHAYHLIMHGDLPGFSPHEVELIANVARYHRRAYPHRRHRNLAHLHREDRRLISRLAGILRVADGLDRSHAQVVTGVRAAVMTSRVRLMLDASALPQVELWDAQRKAGLFLRAFDTDLELVWRDSASRARRRGDRAQHRVLATIGAA